MPIFKKCGPKTCEKYYENKELFLEALTKESEAQEKYTLNKKIVDFNEIPETLVNEFLEEWFVPHGIEITTLKNFSTRKTI